MKYITYIIILLLIHSCVSRNQEIVRDENGNIVSKCDLRNGVRHGKCYHYFPCGAIMAVSNWAGGLREGESIGYFENGNLHSTSMWKDGKQHGKRVDYFENGGIRQTSIWKDNKADGEIVDYFENGNIQQKSFYINDQLIEHEYYVEDGRLQKIHCYIIVNHQSKFNGVITYDVNNIFNNPYGINIQESLHARIFADSDTVNYSNFVEYEVKWMCSENHYLRAFTGHIDHNFNVIDSSSIKWVDLDNKNRFYPSNLGTDTLRVIFDFMKIEDEKELIFTSYLEKVFTVIEKNE